MLITLFSILLIGGCTAINFNAMIKPNAVDCRCKEESNAIKTYLIDKESKTFSYLLPPAVANIAKANKKRYKPVSFKEYNDRIEEAMPHLLPADLAKDPVVTEFRRALTKASA